jgi:hypothetical protein
MTLIEMREVRKRRMQRTRIFRRGPSIYKSVENNSEVNSPGEAIDNDSLHQHNNAAACVAAVL